MREIGTPGKRHQSLLKLFGAESYRNHVRRAAGRALTRYRTLTVAVMAAQMVLRLMQRVVVIAARAFSNPATVVAQQGRRKTPAV